MGTEISGSQNPRRMSINIEGGSWNAAEPLEQWEPGAGKRLELSSSAFGISISLHATLVGCGSTFSTRRVPNHIYTSPSFYFLKSYSFLPKEKQSLSILI